jgi:hypothetical protein
MWNMAAILCGGVQLTASIAGWRNRLMSRGAFVAMVLGSLLLIGGSWLDGQHRVAGIVLAGLGLYLISDSAYYVGTQRETGPRLSHHVLRAAVGVVLLAGLILS